MDTATRMSDSPSSEEMQSLRALVPLHTLPDKVLAELMEHVVVESVKRGEMLFNQGDTDPQHVYLVKGKVALLSDRAVVERIEAGSDTARFPLAHQLPRNFGVRAETKARITRIDSRQLSDLLARSQSVDYQVADFDAASEDDWMSMLLQSRVLQQVPASNLQRVMISVEQVEVSKGEDLIRQGDPGDFYYMLTKGRAVVRRDNGDGKGPIELATLGPGDAFGEEALLSDNPRNSTVTMLHDGNVLRLSKDNFLELINDPLLEQLDRQAAEAKVAQGAIWLDLRSGEQFDRSHLDGAINFPFESLRYQTESLAPDRHYVVYSGTGARAMAGAFLLTERGFDVSVLESGFEDGGVAVAARPTAPAVEPVIAVSAEPRPEPPPIDDASTVAADMQRRVRDAEERATRLEQALNVARSEQEGIASERAQHLAQVREAVDQARRKLVETEEQKREALAAQQKAYGEMEVLTSNLEALQDERTSLIERMSEIKGLDRQLQDRLAKAERDLVRERERAEIATHKFDELSDKLNDEIDRREQERGQHAHERGELKEQLTELRMQLEQANLDVDELREQLAGAQADGKAHADSLAALQAEKHSDDATLAALGDERDALQAQLAELQARLDADAKVQQQLTASEQAATAAAQHSDEQLAEERAARADLQRELDALGVERDEEIRQRQAAEQRDQESGQALQELQQAHAALNESQQELQQQLAEAQRRHEADAETQRDAEGREQASSEALAAAQQQVNELAATRDELLGKIDSINAEREQALAALQTERDNEREAASALHSELDELRSQHNALQSEMASGNEQAGAAIEQAQARAVELEQQISANADEAARALDAKQTELDALGAQLAEVDAERDAQRRSLEQTTEALDAARDERDAASTRVTELEQQLTDDADRLAAQREAAAEGQASLAAAEAQQAADAEALADARRELEDARRALEQAEQQLATLRTERDGAAESADSQRQASEQRIAALEQQLAASQAALQTAQDELDASRSALESAREAGDASAAAEGDLQATLQQMQASHDALQAELDGLRSDNSADTASLRAELAELVQRLEERELALKVARDEQAELIDALNAASAERETLQLAVNDRDEEQARLVDLENQVGEALRVHQHELLAHEQQQHRLQEELDAANDRRRALEEEVERLTELVEEDAATADGDVRAERDALQAELALRENEVGQLRSVIEEYVDQIRAAQSGSVDDPSEIQALRTELEMVREQAIRDVAQMREQLAQAETQKRRLQQADDREVISHEAMRQEIDELKTAVNERMRDLSQADEARHMLEDELEDVNRKLDEVSRELERSQGDAEEAMVLQREAESARDQFRDALQRMQDDADDAAAGDLRDERLRMGKAPIGMDNVVGTNRWLPGLIGAGVVVAALEAISFATGNGELVTLLLRLAGQ